MHWESRFGSRPQLLPEKENGQRRKRPLHVCHSAKHVCICESKPPGEKDALREIVLSGLGSTMNLLSLCVLLSFLQLFAIMTAVPVSIRLSGGGDSDVYSHYATTYKTTHEKLVDKPTVPPRQLSGFERNSYVHHVITRYCFLMRQIAQSLFRRSRITMILLQLARVQASLCARNPDHGQRTLPCMAISRVQVCCCQYSYHRV